MQRGREGGVTGCKTGDRMRRGTKCSAGDRLADCLKAAHKAHAIHARGSHHMPALIDDHGSDLDAIAFPGRDRARDDAPSLLEQ